MPHPDTVSTASRALAVAEVPLTGVVTMSSREIADLTGKRHPDVLRDIRNMLEPLGLAYEQFCSKAPSEGGRPITVANLPRRETLILVSGYSVELRARIIDRLEEMERAARRPALDLNDPASLRRCLLTYTEKVEMLEARVEADKPKTSFYDQFVNADGLYGLQNAGRALGCHPNKFTAWLKQKYLFYQGGNLVPYVEYRRSGLFEVKVTVEGDRSFQRAFITPKGLTYFSARIPDELRIAGKQVEVA